MATTTNLTLAKSGYVKEESAGTVFPTNTSTWYSVEEVNNLEKRLYFGFNAISASLKHKKLMQSRIRVQLRNATEWSHAHSRVYIARADFNPATLTFNNAPGRASATSYANLDLENSVASADVWQNTYFSEKETGTLLQSLAAYFSYDGIAADLKTVLSGGGLPYLQVTYDESTTVASKIEYRSGPQSGYKNPRNAISFGWDYVKASSSQYCAVESWEQSSATFYWKVSTDENYTAVAAGTAKSVTIPANTFPTASTIQWYVSGTDEDGTTSQTSVFSFSTAAATAYAQCLSPIDSVEDGSAPITFRWSISSSDGQPATRIEADWKPDGSDTWTEFLDVNEPATSYDLAANTLPAGQIFWTVRAYNIDGVAGPWSKPDNSHFYGFINVAAPDPVEGLSATAVPFTEVSWQSDGQQAYRVSIDGEIVAEGFGDDVYSWQSDLPLSDGTHEISVSVQGIYGFWSQPSTVTISVANTPGDAVTLNGIFETDAFLSWETEAATADFLIYRDGVRIGHTVQTAFTDQRAIGQHSWKVLNRLPDGNYTESNTITGTLAVESPVIAALDGSGSWITLRLSANSDRILTSAADVTSSLRHFSGAAYPVLEISSYRSEGISLDAAWLPQDPVIGQFEQLLGRVIILKTVQGRLIVGALTAWTRTDSAFYTAYRFTLRRVHYEDFVDDQNS